MSYRAPIREISFALDLAGFTSLRASYAECDEQTLAAILDAAATFAGDVLAPLNRAGDLTGAKFENGRVTGVPGFADAYSCYIEGGWGALSADPDFGGQGLPKVVELAV